MNLPSGYTIVEGNYLHEFIDDFRQQLIAAKHSDDPDFSEIARLTRIIHSAEQASKGRGLVMKVRNLR